MSAIYNAFAEAEANGTTDLLTSPKRLLLLMSNTSARTENDTITNVDDFTTLDEFDGAGYSRHTPANPVVERDNAIDGAKFHFDDALFSALGPGTRQIQSALLIHFIVDDTQSIPIAFFDFDQLKTADGSDFLVQIPDDLLSLVRV